MSTESDNELSIDIDRLTVGEIETIEEITGQAIDELFSNGSPKGKTLRALGYVMKRRTDPNFTLEQAGELVVTLSETPPDPTGGDAAG